MIDALAFLNTDPLRHLPHLKYLHLYPENMDCYGVEAGDGQGVLISYDKQLLSWDRTTYPQADRVFMPVATTPAAARALLDHLLNHYSIEQPAVFKFCDDTTRTVFAQTLPQHFIRAFASYTGDHISPRSDCDDVVISARPETACLEIFAQNGYTADEMQRYFDAGASSFAIYENAEPVCACFIYHNFGPVWEVAGLHTRDSARRRGYARRVTSTALQTILSRGDVPRYHVEMTNTASIQLAESLGLTPCLRFEHYMTWGTDAHG
jgi:ribosomal protein S18 acetylase RimI-like enzyme